AAVSLGLVGDRRLSIAGWAAVIATAAVIDSQSGSAYSDFFWTALILTLAWFFGSALGSRTEQARELSQRVEAAEHARAVAAEDAGLPVTLRVVGERPELSPGVDLSAYRIVQEGLTNALKHAKGAHAEVVVRYIDSSVELEIADDGAGVPSSDGMGHGLVGMR